MGRRLENGSRVNREIYARFCERLWVKLPRPTHPYIKVPSQWKYFYRGVDRAGDTVDFLLTAKRDLAAARRFLERAINLHNVPEKITIDKSGANTAAIESVKADACVDILMRQNKYEGTPHFPVTASSAKIGLRKSIYNL